MYRRRVGNTAHIHTLQRPESLKSVKNSCVFFQNKECELFVCCSYSSHSKPDAFLFIAHLPCLRQYLVILREKNRSNILTL
jgi:hypothetical protein